MHIPHFWFLLLLFVGTSSLVHGKTSSDVVSALNNMFTSLNSPSKLSGWKSSGGDPCGDGWEGIKCSGSSVTEIDLSGKGLSGQLGYQLSNLKDVTYFDVSKNNLKNDIPYQLPPKLNHLDLSNNGFSGSIPYSISEMKGLEYLNMGHNQLNGALTDMFSKLSKLKEMDVSNNQLTGELPHSMEKLSSLETLNLGNNQLTGSINVLRQLPLENLNVKNNKFTGWVPNELKDINSLKTDGNSWSTGQAPPPPPGFKPINHHQKKGDNNKGIGKTALKGLIIALIALAVLVVLALVIVLLTRRKSSPNSNFTDEERAEPITFNSIEASEVSNGSSNGMTKQLRGSGSFDSNDSKSMQSPALKYKPPPTPDLVQSISEKEFAERLNAGRKSTSIRATTYSLSELQSATGNFASGRLLGEGSLGSVYKAKYHDGKVYAVKKIDSSFFEDSRPEAFTQLVASISKVHHPNIAELVGYCAETGETMLVFEYFRNGSLHDFLHLSDAFSKPLTWNTRVRIALGTARAVEYLHEVCSPSFVHKNIKSSNILLDLDLNPRLSDYGLANFHHRTSQNLGEGYNAPECTKPSAYTMKSDIYSFGVVMLELLTGRMPLDHTKRKAEQNLVRWATPQLHDKEALEAMVDPHLHGLYPPKSVSRFADIISICVQREPEFRPSMSEVVESLVKLIQQTNESMREDLGGSHGTGVSDYNYI